MDPQTEKIRSNETVVKSITNKEIQHTFKYQSVHGGIVAAATAVHTQHVIACRLLLHVCIHKGFSSISFLLWLRQQRRRK